MVLNVCYDCLDYQFNIMIHILYYCGGLFIHDCIINSFFFSSKVIGRYADASSYM